MIDSGDSQVYDELSRLNNELVNMQRDLAKKNVELIAANDLLEKRVLERTVELQKAKEEAELANAGKSDFLSRMSHELRTPLNGVLGFAQLMEQGTLDEKQTVRLGHIIKSGRHLLTLIDEILEMTRADAGSQASQKDYKNENG